MMWRELNLQWSEAAFNAIQNKAANFKWAILIKKIFKSAIQRQCELTSEFTLDSVISHKARQLMFDELDVVYLSIKRTRKQHALVFYGKCFSLQRSIFEFVWVDHKVCIQQKKLQLESTQISSRDCNLLKQLPQTSYRHL